MTAPTWLTACASLDDSALTALGNPGLLRRALKAPPAEAHLTEAEAVLTFAGTSPIVVKLGPGSPHSTTCTCAVVGRCAHIIAACLWARQTQDATRAENTDGIPDEPSSQSEASRPVRGYVLEWDSELVNKSAGIDAVRYVYGLDFAAVRTTIVEKPESAEVLWGDSRAVFTRDGDFASIIVAGKHSSAKTKRIKLEACVRIWAAHDRAWSWPTDALVKEDSWPKQQDAALAARAVLESVLEQGLSHLTSDSVHRLTRASELTQLSGLTLLEQVLRAASAQVQMMVNRADKIDEKEVLRSLSRAWALCVAIGNSDASDRPHLIGQTRSQSVHVGQLQPLGVRWWVSDTRARGFTIYWWGAENERVESLTSGRAEGTDLSFSRSWSLPLLWGHSLDFYSSHAVVLHSVKRGEDGKILAASETAVREARPLLPDLSELAGIADHLGGNLERSAAAGFRAPAENVGVLILPKGSMRVYLDELDQSLAWIVSDSGGRGHRLRVKMNGTEEACLRWIVKSKTRVHALTVADGEVPVGAFVGSPVRLISFSVAPPPRALKRREKKRQDEPWPLLRADDVKRVMDSGDALGEWLERVEEFLVSLASSPQRVMERHAAASRVRASLQRLRAESEELGLTPLSDALANLAVVSDGNGGEPGRGAVTAALLRVAFLVSRLREVRLVRGRVALIGNLPARAKNEDISARSAFRASSDGSNATTHARFMSMVAGALRSTCEV